MSYSLVACYPRNRIKAVLEYLTGPKSTSMKKTLLFLLCLHLMVPLKAWWDPGHMLVALIAYTQLNEKARAEVDRLTRVLQRDYPQVNHFIVTGCWPDDLKETGVRSYDTWHYTNIPYNPEGLDVPPNPEVNVVWAIEQARRVLRSEKAADVDRARHLAFLVHFVGDIHQPLHSTTMYSSEQPEGNRGGNDFRLRGKWRNLHMLWDDGCGWTSDYNNIRPYGKPKAPLSAAAIGRLQALARSLMAEYPPEALPGLEEQKPEAWALESHHLAVKHAYRGLQESRDGRARSLQPGDKPADLYLERGQEIVRAQLCRAGYRLGSLLNDTLGQ